jgi:membrane associated rhomboid family serine protease
VTPVVRALLIANIAVFFLQETVLERYEVLLAFNARNVMVLPWTVLTYMFLHGGLMHLLFNMLSLFFFGPRVESMMGSRRFAIMYFLSGITGAIVHVVASLAMGSPGGFLIGASAGVFGVMMGFAHYWPHEVIYIWGLIPVPARLLVILTTIMAYWMGMTGGGGNVAHFAHLGGYAGAFLFLLWLDRRKGAFRKVATAPPVEVAKKVDSGRWKAIDVQKIHQVNRDEVNRILDKISAQGIGSLTPEETLFLSNFVPPDDKPLVS